MTPLTPQALRLALSRERLRLALHEHAHAPDHIHQLLQGLTREHPLAAVLGAAALGAVLARLRPWQRSGAWAGLVAALLPALLPLLTAVVKDQRWSAWLADWCGPTDPGQGCAPFGAAPSASESKKA